MITSLLSVIGEYFHVVFIDFPIVLFQMAQQGNIAALISLLLCLPTILGGVFVILHYTITPIIGVLFNGEE